MVRPTEIFQAGLILYEVPFIPWEWEEVLQPLTLEHFGLSMAHYKTSLDFSYVKPCLVLFVFFINVMGLDGARCQNIPALWASYLLPEVLETII